MKRKTFFIFDVESMGLQGEAFAVGGGVYFDNGAALWEFQFCVDPRDVNGTDSARLWVTENVPLMEITHRGVTGMRSAFWEMWQKAKAGGAIMAVDVGWPVEARFLAACVDDDLANREYDGPYPIFEIATARLLAGFDPVGTCDRTPSEMPPHNPLADARHSARLLSKALEILCS